MIFLRLCICFGCFMLLIQLCSALKDYPWMYYLPYGRTVKLRPLFKNKTEKIVIKSCRWTTPNKQDLIPDVYILDKNRYRIDKSKCKTNNFDFDSFHSYLTVGFKFKSFYYRDEILEPFLLIYFKL